MTVHCKRQRHTDQKPEVVKLCWDRKWNDVRKVDNQFAACTHNEDDNKQNEDDWG